jgi:hypothetical protein
MYEIGLAHALGKPIVLLTRNEEDVPFDLRVLRFLYYDPNNPSWGQDLRKELTLLVSMVLGASFSSPHLTDIAVRVNLPDAPTEPLAESVPETPSSEFSGVWQTEWISIQKGRKTLATLVIPTGQTASITASMTVTYVKNERRTIVQEALTGTARGNCLSLTGVNYTYVEQGASTSYSLDSFDLRLAENRLLGTVTLRHGTRDVTFERLRSGAR